MHSFQKIKLQWPVLLVGVVLVTMILKAVGAMNQVSLVDFDEGVRAESARNMLEFGHWVVPLNGGPFFRPKDLAIPLTGDSSKFVYPVLERPPLQFWFMALSSRLFGDREFAYRLPSFVFGVLTIWLIGFLPGKRKDGWLGWGGVLGLVTIGLSQDWWLSAQLAHQDTALAFFMTLVLVLLWQAGQSKKSGHLVGAGVAWGLAFLSKGQPAILLLVPLILLGLSKKLRFKDGVIVVGSAGLTVLPWIVWFAGEYGLARFVNVYVWEFVKLRAIIPDPTQQAAMYWYGRWWLGVFRPGIILLGSLVFWDIVKQKLNSKKVFLLSYIGFGVLFFSLTANKVWWYVLPFIPAVAWYVGESGRDYLTKGGGLVNLAIVLVLGSLSCYSQSGDKEVILWGGLMTFVSFGVLLFRSRNRALDKVAMVFALVFAAGQFWQQFPTPQPGWPETRRVGEYFANLPGDKCLWIKDMPYESMLYYSKAREVNYWKANVETKQECENYLVSPATEMAGWTKLFNVDRLTLYKYNNFVL